jgi:hypothetical protein
VVWAYPAESQDEAMLGAITNAWATEGREEQLRVSRIPPSRRSVAVPSAEHREAR